MLLLYKKNMHLVGTELQSYVPGLSSGKPGHSIWGLWWIVQLWDSFFSEKHRFYTVTIIPQILHTHIPFIRHRRFQIIDTDTTEWQNIFLSLGMSLCALHSSNSEKFHSSWCSLNSTLTTKLKYQWRLFTRPILATVTPCKTRFCPAWFWLHIV